MNRDQIINIFGSGQVSDAIMLARNNGYNDLAENFEKAVSHVKDPKIYLEHYRKNNGRIAGAQIQGKGGPDSRQAIAMDHVRELKAETLLDIGCADGSFCVFCLERKIVKSVIGIDPWVDGINWATDYFNHNNMNGVFINALLEDVTLDDYKFDAIHLGEILEHVIDPVAILMKLRKYPIKGIVITIPTERPPITPNEEILLTDGRVAEHVRLISLQNLYDYCRKSGFEIVNTDTIGFGWVNLIATIK